LAVSAYDKSDSTTIDVKVFRQIAREMGFPLFLYCSTTVQPLGMPLEPVCQLVIDEALVKVPVAETS
jgi:hypothetical protein